MKKVNSIPAKTRISNNGNLIVSKVFGELTHNFFLQNDLIVLNVLESSVPLAMRENEMLFSINMCMKSISDFPLRSLCQLIWFLYTTVFHTVTN